MRHEFVEKEIGIKVSHKSGEELFNHVGLALRNNKKRAHLIVSHILGKHIPVKPSKLIKAVQSITSHIEVDGKGVVIGYAETATSLGFLVAKNLNLSYIHSTRYPIIKKEYGAFEESHSHATSHVLTPKKHNMISKAKTVVLVDDELTTGSTIINTIISLETIAHHDRYIIVTLLDGRSDENKSRMREFAQEIGSTIEVYAHTVAYVEVPENAVEISEKVMAGLTNLKTIEDKVQESDKVRSVNSTSDVAPIRRSMSLQVPHTYTDLSLGVESKYFDDLDKFASEVSFLCFSEGRTLILGAEEFMSLPLLVAEKIEENGKDVNSSTTTISPVFVHDDGGYAIRSVIKSDFLNKTVFAYNVDGFDSIVLLADEKMQYRTFYESLLEQVDDSVNITFINLIGDAI